MKGVVLGSWVASPCGDDLGRPCAGFALDDLALNQVNEHCGEQ